MGSGGVSGIQINRAVSRQGASGSALAVSTDGRPARLRRRRSLRKDGPKCVCKAIRIPWRRLSIGLLSSLKQGGGKASSGRCPSRRTTTAGRCRTDGDHSASLNDGGQREDHLFAAKPGSRYKLGGSSAQPLPSSSQQRPCAASRLIRSVRSQQATPALASCAADTDVDGAWRCLRGSDWQLAGDNGNQYRRSGRADDARKILPELLHCSTTTTLLLFRGTCTAGPSRSS